MKVTFKLVYNWTKYAPPYNRFYRYDGKHYQHLGKDGLPYVR